MLNDDHRLMDPITHVILGASCGYTLFHRQLGRTAAAVGGLAGAAPDVDTFIRSASDPLLAIEYHRHFTHSVVFAPLGALIVASLWMAQSRWREHWKTLWLCALIGYISHSLLDSATSYGTLLLWPFTKIRFGWDWISIIDLLFTLPLMGLLLISLIKSRPKFAWAGLCWAAGYMLLGILQHERAITAQMRLAEQRGHKIERRELMPTMANNVVWRSLYQFDGQIYSDRIRVGWFSLEPTIKPGTHLLQITSAGLTEEERKRDGEAKAFDRFFWFSDGWVARSPLDTNVLADMRYSLSTKAFDPIWGIRYSEVNDIGPAVKWVNRSRERRLGLSELWGELIGQTDGYQPLVESK